MQRTIPAVIASLLLAPPGATAADLVVWWEKGYYEQEGEALREIIGAFEQESGKQVELAQPTESELPGKIVAAFEAGKPPDFVFGVLLQDYIGPWAADDRLADLSEVIRAFSNLFDPDSLAWVTWRDPKTGTQPSMGYRSGAKSTTSTSGRAF
jgi:ABC-type glycerol-3-phosphate transport system substrate-binding protein